MSLPPSVAAADDAPAPAVRRFVPAAPYVAAVFTSAFLLFLVQPLFSRMVLPLLGGSPAVWNTCMLFFQAALLGGYLYAHLSTRWLGVRRQAVAHAALLAVAALALPVGLRGMAPAGGDSPVTWLMATMALTVGPPFLVLAGTGPMLQRWFAHSGRPDAADPYRLYAASNLGSLVALLGYPLFVEPRLRLADQSLAWSVGYGGLFLLIVGCGLLSRGTAPVAPAAETGDAEEAPSAPARPWRDRAVWTGLAFVPSSLLLSVTTFLTTDLTPIPLLWVVPLALYLLTFTLVFAPRNPVRHDWMVGILPPLAAAVVVILLSSAGELGLGTVPIHLGVLFVAAMVCHGELARRRPAVDRLTDFYLWIAVGGVLGGIFNVLVAPVVFDRTWEYPLGLVLACLALPVAALAPGERSSPAWHVAVRAALCAYGLAMVGSNHLKDFPGWLYAILITAIIFITGAALRRAPAGLAGALAGAVVLHAVAFAGERDVLMAERSFFGQFSVGSVGDPPQFHALYHGTTLHGAQSVWPGREDVPLTYYARTGPAGVIFAAKPFGVPGRRVAVVGLGAGTLAAYARPGDDWTFYEIDPDIERIARDTTLFTYLHRAQAPVRVVLGDGRLSLAESERQYDLILLDAFSSDAVPTHLMTREALDVYLERLAPGGLVAYHVSNRYLRLEPVVGALARDAGLVARESAGPVKRDPYETVSQWIVVARQEADLGTLARDSRWSRVAVPEGTPVWTDDYSSVLSVVRRPAWMR